MHGHHIGVYALGNTYDFEAGKLGSRIKNSAFQSETGNLSYLSYGTGITYGYAFPIAKKWNLDFGISVGYYTGEYMVYKPVDSDYVWQETMKRNYFGITGAQISLVYVLGCRNHNR
jgi:hypothetical protein